MSVCEVCGAQFDPPRKNLTKRTCGPSCRNILAGRGIAKKFGEPSYRTRHAKNSSERMRRRRNGGDPALNAILSARSSERFKRLWSDEDFRAARIAESSARIAAFNSDAQRVAKKNAASKAIMTKAARRLAHSGEWRLLMREKTTEHMAIEPYNETAHGDYVADYLSMMMARVNSDPQVRAFAAERMRQYIPEAAKAYNESKR